MSGSGVDALVGSPAPRPSTRSLPALASVTSGRGFTRHSPALPTAGFRNVKPAPPSLRGAKRRSNPSRRKRRNGLLRSARNDGGARFHVLAANARGLLWLLPSKSRGHRECRALCTPAASYALVESIRVRHHRYAETFRHSLRKWVTAYSALSPETGL